MNSLKLSGISASSCSDKGHDLVSCIFHTIVLPAVTNVGIWHAYCHVLHELWAFILVVSFCPACGAQNDLTPFVVVLILLQWKC
jgi:hypothetical protein